MISPSLEEEILSKLTCSLLTGRKFRHFAMSILSNIGGYDWCGIYRMVDGALVLDAYVGAETDHTKIEVGVGVCGTAVAERKNQVIEDVREISNYLACSTTTRSEIVVLIKNSDEILGQIDIDGHEVGSFNMKDEQFLEEVASILASRWEETP